MDPASSKKKTRRKKTTLSLASYHGRKSTVIYDVLNVVFDPPITALDLHARVLAHIVKIKHEGKDLHARVLTPQSAHIVTTLNAYVMPVVDTS